MAALLAAACSPTPSHPAANISEPGPVPGSSFVALDPGLTIETAVRMSNGDVYLLGSGKSEYGYHTEDHWLVKAHTDGTIDWRRPLDTTTATGMAIVDAHRLALIGLTETEIPRDRDGKRGDDNKRPDHPAARDDAASGQSARRNTLRLMGARTSASDIELIDTEGRTLWRKPVLEGQQVHLFDVAANPSAIFAAGFVIAEDGMRSDALLMKYDTQGNALWQRRLAGPGPTAPTSHWISALALLPDGRILATGGSVFEPGLVYNEQVYTGSGIGWLALLGADGKPLWTRWLDDAPLNPEPRRPDRDPPANYDELTTTSLSLAVEGDTVYVARAARSYSTHMLYRFTLDGARLWMTDLSDRVRPGIRDDSRIFRPLAMAPDADGVFIAGIGDGDMGDYAGLMRVSTDGAVQWKRLYGTRHERHELNTIFRDGAYLAAYGGRVCSTWCGGPHTRGWLLRTDLNGALEASELEELLASHKGKKDALPMEEAPTP